MFTVLVYKDDDECFWLEEEKDFDFFSQALDYAIKNGSLYEVFKDYDCVSSCVLIARSSYEKWSR